MSDFLPVEEAQAFLANYPKLEWVDVIFFDLNGVPRGKRYRPSEIAKLASGGSMVASSVYSLDIRGLSRAETGLLWETGDPDIPFRMMSGTLVPLGGKDATRAQVVIIPAEDYKGLDPRTILQRQVSLLRAAGSNPVTAVELEFYLTQKPNGHFALNAPDGLSNDPDNCRLYEFNEIDRIQPVIDRIYQLAEVQKLPIGALLQETGPAQFEINLNHRHDAVQAAFDGLLLKRAIKTAAEMHGLAATFMAKPHHEWSGSGMHVHTSLVDETGRNQFAGDSMPDRFRHAIGGLQSTMADFMPVWAQSANAYRRYMPKSYVPLAATWGNNNRNVALRLPRSSGPATRIEHRVAGADANPLLVMSAILAGMHHGITNKIEPGPLAEGEGSNSAAPALPTAWVNSLAAFEKSKVAKSALGASFHDVYFKLKTAERLDFERIVTDVDYQWYGSVA